MISISHSPRSISSPKEGDGQSSLECFLGKHSLCDYEAPDTELLITASERVLIQAVIDALEGTVSHFDFVVQGATTQIYESFKSQKARFASKNHAWRDSWTNGFRVDEKTCRRLPL
jgi:hypothetical protein